MAFLTFATENDYCLLRPRGRIGGKLWKTSNCCLLNETVIMWENC
jgi:hypothetical protein